MVSRRSFVALTCSSFVSAAFSQSPDAPADDVLPPLPPDLQSAAGEPDYFSVQLNTAALGTADPGDKKKAFAREILDAAPANCRPIKVAYFFRDLGLGNTRFGQEGRPYARGWPRIYNPVIIELFKTTGLNPLSPSFDGDETAWCAAFINYCVVRGCSKDGNDMKNHLDKGTRSASSGSFRCFGKEITGSPKEGDIAVWAQDGTVSGCKPGKGHVGFYVDSTSDPAKPYRIMGGNQSGDLLKGTDTRNDGMFLKAMPEKYPIKQGSPVFKRFFAFRTADYL